ncbi:MAG: hypothetical protein ACK4K0_11325 [Flavobacteriales bacterium]
MKKQLYIFILIGAFGGFLAFAYNYFQRFSEDRLTALSSVPQDAAFVVEFSAFSATWENFTNTNLVWSDLVSLGYTNELQNDIEFVDSLIKTNSYLKHIYSNAPLVVSIHPQSSKSAVFLSWQHNVAINSVDVKKSIQNNNSIELKVEKNIGNNLVFQVQIIGVGNWYISASRNLLIASNSLSVIESSLKKLEESTPDNSTTKLLKLKALTGNSSKIRFYTNFDQVKRIFANNMAPEGIKWLSGTSPAKWTGTDIITQPNGFSMQGYSIVDSASSLSVYKNQQPGAFTSQDYIPQNSVALVHIAISNYKEWYANLSAPSTQKAIVERVTENCNCAVETTIGNWIGDEASIFYVLKNEKIRKNILIKSSGLANPIGLLKDESIETTNEIYQLKDPDLLEAGLGKLFKYNQNVYFTILNDFVLFGTDSSDFSEIKIMNEVGRTLSYDEDYIQFSSRYIQDKSSFLLYTNLYNLFKISESAFSDETKKELSGNKALLQKFSAIGWQSKMINQVLMYHNVNLVYNAQAKVKSNILWQAKLDTEILGKAWYIKNHRTNTLDVLVQDQNFKLYQINATGKVLWTKQLEGKIVGDISQIDIFNNNRYQTLLACSDKLHLIDILGNSVNGFPITLKAAATSAPAALDYEKKKDYRFIIACGKKLYNYDKSGKPVEGWEFNTAEQEIKFSPVHLVIDGKDYIATYDSGGMLYLVDRRGNIRIRINKKIQTLKVAFVKGKSLATSRVIYADSLNSIKQLYFDEKETILLEDSSINNKHFKMINQNGEFLYLAVPGQDRIEFYGADGKVIELTPLKSSRISDFDITQLGSKRVITTLNRNSNEITVSIKTNSVEKTYSFDGETPPAIADINNDGMLNMLTTKGKFVIMYSIQ